jgi:hypothetical protein
MPFLIWPEVLIAIVLVAIMARVGSSTRQSNSEESAHAAALERRRGRSGRRGGHQSVLVLGSEDGEAPCQVIRVSRCAIRIHSARLLPADSQLQVERGGDCFVCGIRKVAPAEGGWTMDLNVIASNHEHRGFWRTLRDSCRRDVG